MKTFTQDQMRHALAELALSENSAGWLAEAYKETDLDSWADQITEHLFGPDHDVCESCEEAEAHWIVTQQGTDSMSAQSYMCKPCVIDMINDATADPVNYPEFIDGVSLQHLEKEPKNMVHLVYMITEDSYPVLQSAYGDPMDAHKRAVECISDFAGTEARLANANTVTGISIDHGIHGNPLGWTDDVGGIFAWVESVRVD